MTDHNTLADDMLHGAAAISKFFYGDDKATNRKRIYHLAESGSFPSFRMGGGICARKSVLLAHIEDQEHAAMDRFSKKARDATKLQHEV